MMLNWSVDDVHATCGLVGSGRSAPPKWAAQR
jgi:hypothetical protein